ncbi:MAG: hypothetical protein HY704_12165 [Gemmatimonadetes bacterium]|nr:hypothetical protein [Gemmatimonadota bacterium]
MVTKDDVESFLIRMAVDYDEVDEGMFVVRSRPDGAPIVVHHSPPVLLVRMKVMDVPEDEAKLLPLFRTLLELNATDVVHGAYGIENGEVILSDTLELETLDFQELQASLESLQLAATSQMGRILELSSLGGEV